jgi:hypothetical protein
MSTPISVRLIDILERAAEDARVFDHYQPVLALILAAEAVVRASRGQTALEPEEHPSPPDEH